MATHSSMIAWKIPWMEKPGGHQSMGLKREDMTEWLTYMQHNRGQWALILRPCGGFFLFFLPQTHWVTRITEYFFSVQFSRSVVSDSLQPHEWQHARPPLSITNSQSSPNPRPSSWWCHPAISSSVIPFYSYPNPSQHQSLFQWVNSSHEVATVLEFQLQHHSFQRTPRPGLLPNGLVGSPCSPWDSQESSPTPQFKNINSSVLSLLHSPTLTSMHDHRKNHSLD